jgi:tripartite-type tricarboxylate transporter receptor subunit TctC
MRNLTCFTLLLIAAVAVASSAVGRSYPVKPIRMIIGFPPGGGTDIIGRIVAQRLGDGLKQQIVPDNRGGALSSWGGF